MYGVSAEQVQASVQNVNSPFTSLRPDDMQTRNASGYRNIGMIHGRSGSANQNFRLTPRNNLIVNSLVPAQRRPGTPEYVACLHYGQSSVNTLIRSFNASGSPAELTGVQYKDPCVLYLASIGRWMMVLCRTRVFSNSGGPYSANPFTAISDVVAFTSSVSTFTLDVQGPFWLADSISALGAPGYRLSLGVPCAFEYTDSTGSFLYLYYSIDPCDLTHNQPQPPGTLNIGSGVYVDIGTYPGGTFVSQLGVKVMATSHFSSAPTVPEALWEVDSSNYQGNVVPGVLQTTVNLWVAVYGLPYRVVSFDEASENARPVDPSVVVDPTLSTQDPGNIRSSSSSIGQDISLYFAANMIYSTQNTITTSYGIWRATAVPASWFNPLDVYDGRGNSLGSAYTTFGVDFVIRGATFDAQNGNWIISTTDSVAASTTSTDANVDPEPVMLLSGTWRVFMGHGDVYSPGGTVTLQYVENGNSSDVFCSISNAWT